MYINQERDIIFSKINRERERERERVCNHHLAQMEVAQLVRLPNGDQVVMGSTPIIER